MSATSPASNVPPVSGVGPQSAGKPSPGKASPGKPLNERTNGAARSALDATQVVVRPTVGSRIWSVVRFLLSPLYWIADGISIVYRAIFEDEDEDDDYYRKRDVNRNAAAIKNLESSFKDALERQKMFDKLGVAPLNFASPKEFVKWLQLPQEAERLERDLASIVAEIAEGRTSLTNQIIALSPSTTDKPKEIDVDNSKDVAEQQKTLSAQLKQLEQLDAALKPVVTFSSRPICVQWQLAFEGNQAQVFQAFQQTQRTTLGLLEQLEKGGKKAAIDRKALAPYYEYMTLFRLLQVLKIGNEDATHQKIQQIGATLAQPLSDDVGLRNLNELPPAQKKGRGNTCWLNSAIQSMRRSPAIMTAMKAPIQRRVEPDEQYKFRQAQYVIGCVQQPGEKPEAYEARKAKPVMSLSETDGEWKNRQMLHNVLRNIFAAMELGDADTINRGVEALEHLLATLPEVPSELRQKRGEQKDISYAFLCFLGVVDYRLNFQAHKLTKDGRDEVLLRENEVVWNFPMVGVKKDASLVERLEIGSREEVVTHTGNYTKERRLTALPRFFITMANRFEGEAPAVPDPAKQWTKDDQQKLEALLKLDPDFYHKVTALVKAGTLKNELAKPYGKKVEDAILFPKNNIVDLSKSFLTADLAPIDRQRAKFRLTSFPYHRGGLNGGHYTAYGQGLDGKWRHFDDSNVSQPNGPVLAEKLATSYLQLWELVDEGDQKERAEEVIIPIRNANPPPAAVQSTNTTATETSTDSVKPDVVVAAVKPSVKPDVAGAPLPVRIDIAPASFAVTPPVVIAVAS